MRLSNRVTRLETQRAPSPLPAALLIPRELTESREQALERYFVRHPEHRGDTMTPRVFLTLKPFPGVNQ